MMGFKEDLLFAVTSYIIDNWDRLDGNVNFLADKVRKSGLSVDDISDYLVQNSKTCPVCVEIVFNAIVNPIEV